MAITASIVRTVWQRETMAETAARYRDALAAMEVNSVQFAPVFKGFPEACAVADMSAPVPSRAPSEPANAGADVSAPVSPEGRHVGSAGQGGRVHGGVYRP